jgi:hypothetical protein
LKLYEDETDTKLSSDLKKDIIYGTKAEDNMWEPARLFNWHFYYQNDHIEKRTKFLKMRRTSEHIFAKRVQNMEDAKSKGKGYGESIGRVLHHIQDMNTPSHVVPIYHISDDYFESFMVDTLEAGKLDPIIPEESEKLFSTLMEQYKLAAENTFKFIQERKIDVQHKKTNERLPLNIFWRDHKKEEDPKRPGFGTFSEAQEVFKRLKKDQYNTNFSYEGRLYHIELDELYKICNLISGRAIKETVRTLHYIGL